MGWRPEKAPLRRARRPVAPPKPPLCKGRWPRRRRGRRGCPAIPRPVGRDDLGAPQKTSSGSLVGRGLAPAAPQKPHRVGGPTHRSAPTPHFRFCRRGAPAGAPATPVGRDDPVAPPKKASPCQGRWPRRRRGRRGSYTPVSLSLSRHFVPPAPSSEGEFGHSPLVCRRAGACPRRTPRAAGGRGKPLPYGHTGGAAHTKTAAPAEAGAAVMCYL